MNGALLQSLTTGAAGLAGAEVESDSVGSATLVRLGGLVSRAAMRAAVPRPVAMSATVIRSDGCSDSVVLVRWGSGVG